MDGRREGCWGRRSLFGVGRGEHWPATLRHLIPLVQIMFRTPASPLRLGIRLQGLLQRACTAHSIAVATPVFQSCSSPTFILSALRLPLPNFYLPTSSFFLLLSFIFLLFCWVLYVSFSFFSFLFFPSTAYLTFLTSHVLRFFSFSLLQPI